MSEKERFEHLFSDLYENRFASRETAFYLWELVRHEIQDDRFFVWANPLRVATSLNLTQPGVNEMRLNDLKERAPFRLGCAFKIGDRSTLMPYKHVWGYGLSFWFDKELVKKLSELTDKQFDNGEHSRLLSEFNKRLRNESDHRPRIR
ncbi:MAG TPA: hypothetical protein PKD26_00520 [Pyrinomonadaceae bacterium]|nr:hypothetical protein [Pyrinomonadaceae bacterium]